MNLFKTCLLLLLSLALPVQAAMAAGAGGCLRHLQPGQPGPGHVASTVTVAPAVPAVVRSAVSSSEQNPQDPSAPAPAGCPHHAAAAPEALPAPADTGANDASCSSCDFCCLGTALPSPGLRWTAATAPQAHPVTVGLTPPSTVGRLLERPPRAATALH